MARLFARQLKCLGACEESIKWVGDKEFEEAWASCEDIGWMFWLAEKLEVDLKLFVQAACRCARLVLHLVPKEEERPRRAIEAAEAWLEGRVSIEEVQVATGAARAAAVASWAATAAARAVETAARVAWDARIARDARAAARVAGAATWAAEAAAYGVKAADSSIKQHTFSIIREILITSVREKLAVLEI